MDATRTIFYIDQTTKVTVRLAPGETVTVSAHPEDGLIVREHAIFTDEVGPRELMTTTHTGETFGTNSRDGAALYWFMRR